MRVTETLQAPEKRSPIKSDRKSLAVSLTRQRISVFNIFMGLSAYVFFIFTFGWAALAIGNALVRRSAEYSLCEKVTMQYLLTAKINAGVKPVQIFRGCIGDGR
jgi:hypothetical protein